VSGERMFGLQRQERLLEELRRHGAVRVVDLARELGVSELTVRRDIAALAERNLLTKVHGGATLPTRLTGPPEPPRAQQTRFTIGMVVPSLDYYWPSIVTGARTAAAVLGVNVQLRGSSYDPAEDRRQITRLIEARQVQGLLLAPSQEDGGVDELTEWISTLQVPTILVERYTTRWSQAQRPLEWVRSDHSLGLEMAVRHLYDQGHTKIGLVLSHTSPTSAHLVNGWRSACAELRLGDEMVVRESVALDAPRHREIIAEVLRECRRRGTTALIVHSDRDAMSIAQYCTEQGMSIPGDLAMVTYDDEVAHLAEPALTAVRPRKKHVGRTAVELMVSRLTEGSRRPSQRVLVVPELVIRNSSMTRPER
jgi:DNA-binding LacI/PurR family transcriptional regulator